MKYITVPIEALNVPYECGGYPGTVLDMVRTLKEEYAMMQEDKELITQFERVFGGCTWCKGRISAPGWPDMMQYDREIAISVLKRFKDFHGKTEKGDSEVCNALEIAGVV